MNLSKNEDPAGESGLNPDFNFWEKRGERAAGKPSLVKSTAASAADPVEPIQPTAAAPLAVDPAQATPPDASHTLLHRGRWVRPWGLRNFIYSFAAFFGLQTVLVVLVTFVLAAQMVAASGSDALLNDPSSLSEKILGLAQTPGGLVIGALSMYVVWLGYMWWATAKRGARSWAKDFGLWFKKRDVLIGVATAAALFGLESGASALLQNVLAPNADYSGMDNGVAFTNQSALAFFFISITIAGIVGPISEELYFRGFLLTGIQRFFGRYAPELSGKLVGAIAIVVSSIVFGLLHFQGLETFGQILVIFYTGSVGIVLAIYRVAFKRLGPGIFTHIAFNTGSLLLVYFAVGS